MVLYTNIQVSYNVTNMLLVNKEIIVYQLK